MEEAVEWVKAGSHIRIDSVQSELRVLSITACHTKTEVVFDVVPSGWTVEIRSAISDQTIYIRSRAQKQGVRWRLLPAGERSTWILGASLRSIMFAPQRDNVQVNVIGGRVGGTYTLEPAHYVFESNQETEVGIKVRAVGSQAASGQSLSTRKLRVSGSADVARLESDGTVTCVVENPAVEFIAHMRTSPLTLSGASQKVSITSRSSVTLSDTNPSWVEIKARSLRAGVLQARGTIECADIRCLEIGPETGSLSVTTRRLICDGSGQRLKLNLVSEREAWGLARFGAGREERDAVVEVSSPEVGDSGREKRRRVFIDGLERLHGGTTGDQSVPVLATSTVSGDGDLEAWGDTSALTVDLDGRVLCTGELNLSSLGPRKSHFAEEIVVNGFMRLGKSRLRIGAGLDAREVWFGVIERHRSTDEVESTLRTEKLWTVEADIDHIHLSSEGLSDEEVPPRSEPVMDCSKVTSRRSIYLGGDVVEGSEIRWHGQGHFAGYVDTPCVMEWRPSVGNSGGTGPETFLSGGFGPIAVIPDELSSEDLIPWLMLESNSVVEELNLRGAVGISGSHVDSFGTNFNRDAEAATISKVVLGENCTLYLDSSITRLERVEVTSSAELVTQKGREDEPTLVGLAGRNCSIKIDASAQPLVLVNPSSIDLEVERQPANLSVVLEGGTLIVEALVQRLVCPKDTGVVPTLDVREPGRVESVSGVFDLARLDGFVSGAAPGEGDLGSLRRWEGDLPSGRKGQLVDVDLSEASISSIPCLKSLEVLSPLSEPLLKSARDLKHANPETARRKAQFLRELSDVVRARAVSGGTYTASAWAAAHSHALQLKRPSFERGLRFVHRWFGYSVRPLPAFIAFLSWTLTAATILCLWDSAMPTTDPGAHEYRCGSPVSEDLCRPYTPYDSLYRALLMPLAVVRSDIGGAKPFAPAFDHPGAHAGFVLVTSIVLGFFVVALKNYLLRPKGD